MTDADNGVMPENRDGCKGVQARDYRLMTQPERRALRNLYVNAQDGICAHCGGKLAGQPIEAIVNSNIDWRRFPGGKQGFLRFPVHLHHDHKTGMTIGAVHAFCNAHLWQFYGE